MALRIKEIAKTKGITMADIAEKIGISPVNLSTSLNGNPTLNRLQEVADVLGVDVPDLFVKENTSEISGFLEYNGKVYKIDDMEDFRVLSNVIEVQEQR